jgi:hypothetical protein
VISLEGLPSALCTFCGMRGRQHHGPNECIDDLRNALAIAVLRGNRSAEAKLGAARAKRRGVRLGRPKRANGGPREEEPPTAQR